MAQHLLKIFSFPTPANSQVIFESQYLFLRDHFYLSIGENISEEVVLGITQNYLLLLHVILSIKKSFNGTNVTYFSPLSFNLKFGVIRKQWYDEKIPGQPIGLEFESNTEQESIKLYHRDIEVLKLWIKKLGKKINQKYFHKLFKAKKKIGKGAFATVYLAERLEDKKMVAVKAFSKQKQFSGEKGKESLQNQIKIMRKIDHENLNKLLQVYETDNSIYVILEFLEGKQLNQELRSGRKFTLQESLLILKYILRGLAHLSSKRIIHRDIKPENIMFKYQGELQISICDFGLATYADEQKYLFVRCGTPGFVAPEIINEKNMSARSQPVSDIFSAGVIAHYLFFGHSVFSGKKYNEILIENRASEFDFSKFMYKQLDQQCLQLLTRMLQKNPTKRISAQEALRMPIFNNQMQEEEPRVLNTSQLNIIKGDNKPNKIWSKQKIENLMINNENRPLSNFASFNIGNSIKGKMPYLLKNNNQSMFMSHQKQQQRSNHRC